VIDTVLVLGAGASRPYGFPLGQGLKDQIARGDHELPTLLGDCGFDGGEINRFVTRLAESDTYTIDQFLEFHPEFRDIGRHAIAGLLMKYEDEAALRPQQGHWYRLFFNEMLSGGGFTSRRFGVITFNYERSLQHYLHGQLRNLFSNEPTRAASEAGRLPLYHVHGQLGGMPWQSDCGMLLRDYRNSRSSTEVKRCAESIRVIGDTHPHDVWEDAEALLSGARIVISLGLGFHSESLDRLGVKRWGLDKLVVGTAYELTLSNEPGLSS
jgi:hypothetical protein